MSTVTGLKQLLANVVLAILGVGVIYGAAVLVNKAFTGRYLFLTMRVGRFDSLSLQLGEMPLIQYRVAPLAIRSNYFHYNY